jgi:hypothetical protein
VLDREIHQTIFASSIEVVFLCRHARRQTNLSLSLVVSHPTHPKVTRTSPTHIRFGTKSFQFDYKCEFTSAAGQFRSKNSCSQTFFEFSSSNFSRYQNQIRQIMSAESNGKPTQNGNGSAVVKSDDASLLPHLESWERMMKLPVVEAAWTQSQGVYDKVRGELEDPRRFRHVICLSAHEFSRQVNQIAVIEVIGVHESSLHLHHCK